MNIRILEKISVLRPTFLSLISLYDLYGVEYFHLNNPCLCLERKSHTNMWAKLILSNLFLVNPFLLTKNAKHNDGFRINFYYFFIFLFLSKGIVGVWFCLKNNNKITDRDARFTWLCNGPTRPSLLFPRGDVNMPVRIAALLTLTCQSNLFRRTYF